MSAIGGTAATQEAIQTGPSAEEEVRLAEQLRFAALVNGDLDAFDELCDGRFIYTHSTGHQDSKQSFSVACRGGIIRYHRIDATAEKIVLAGNCAVVTGSMEADLTVSGALRTVHNLATSVWINEAGAWKLLASHMSAKPA
jgi:Domain of unknown function (DUF4440)